MKRLLLTFSFVLALAGSARAAELFSVGKTLTGTTNNVYFGAVSGPAVVLPGAGDKSQWLFGAVGRNPGGDNEHWSLEALTNAIVAHQPIYITYGNGAPGTTTDVFSAYPSVAGSTITGYQVNTDVTAGS